MAVPREQGDGLRWLASPVATAPKKQARREASPLDLNGRVKLQNQSRWPVIKLGYKLMSEEHGPGDLVRNAMPTYSYEQMKKA